MKTSLSEKLPDNVIRQYPFVCHWQNEDVSWIRLNRPTRGNSLNSATLFNLHKTVELAIADPKTCGIVITAADPGFVMGADIDYLIRNIDQDRFDRIHDYTDVGNDCFDLIAGSPKPIVALVNGSALGGGFELALACHARFALRGSSFSLPETGIGLCPLWGGIHRLVELLGTETAKWLVYSGKIVSAADAKNWGLVNEIVIPENAVVFAQTGARKRHTTSGKKLPSQIPDVRLFNEKRIAAIFREPLPETAGKTLVSAIRRIKQNCLTALLYSELIFDSVDMTPLQRIELYRKIVEVLYRSEDTKIGLAWKRQGKLGSPPFPSQDVTSNMEVCVDKQL